MKAVKKIFKHWEMFLLVFLVLEFVIFGAVNPKFLRPQSIMNSIVNYISVCIIALFVTLVMITGGIDIQAGSIVGLTSIIIGVAWQDFGFNIWGAVVLAIVAAARPVLEQGAGYIRRGTDFPDQKAGTVDKLKSGPVNTLFYRFNVRAKPFHVAGSCVSCGKCAAACPLGNIRMEQGLPVWGNRCTHCMACICGCPAGAIEYGNASRGKPRYQCPDYQG